MIVQISVPKEIECNIFYFEVTESSERSGKINTYWMGHVAGSAAKTIDTELNVHY